MLLPRAEDRRSSRQQGMRGWRTGRVGLHTALTVFVALVWVVPALGGEPPGHPGTSTVSEGGEGS